MRVRLEIPWRAVKWRAACGNSSLALPTNDGHLTWRFHRSPFFVTSENAVKAQIWIAVSVYVLVAIVRKRLQLSASLYEVLQILSLTMFERTPLDQLLAQTTPTETLDQQLSLFE